MTNDEAARRARAERLRAQIDRLIGKGAPRGLAVPGGGSPRESTDEAARQAADEAGGDGVPSPRRSRQFLS